MNLEHCEYLPFIIENQLRRLCQVYAEISGVDVWRSREARQALSLKADATALEQDICFGFKNLEELAGIGKDSQPMA